MAQASHSTPERDDSRRHFIRGSSLMLASALPSGGAAKTIRLGLAGCDKGGVRQAVQALQTSELDVRLVALSDRRANRLQQAARALKGRFADQFEVPPDGRLVGQIGCPKQWFQNLDVIVVSSEAIVAAPFLQAAMQTGVDILLEHPLTPASVQAQLINASPESRLLRPRVAIETRHQLSVQIAGALHWISGGGIGTIQHIKAQCAAPNVSAVEARRPPMAQVSNGSGPSFDSPIGQRVASHRHEIGSAAGAARLSQLVELLNWARTLFGATPTSVSAVACQPSTRVGHESNQLKLVYDFPQGATLECHWQEASLPQIRQVSLAGSRGRCDATKCKQSTPGARPPSAMQRLASAIADNRPLDEMPVALEASRAAVAGLETEVGCRREC